MKYEWEVIETVLNSSVAMGRTESLEEAKAAAIEAATKHSSIDPPLPLRVFILDGDQVHVCEWDTKEWYLEELPAEGMVTIGMCKNCISYRAETSKCVHPCWVEGCAVLLDQVELTGDNGYRATASVGPNFGCIHWESK